MKTRLISGMESGRLHTEMYSCEIVYMKTMPPGKLIKTTFSIKYVYFFQVVFVLN
jgi:hypothetical protein